MHVSQHLEEIPAEDSRHGVTGHQGDKVNLHYPRLRQAQDEIRPLRVFLRFQKSLESAEMVVGLLCPPGGGNPGFGKALPVFLHEDVKVPLELHASGPEQEFVLHAFFQTDTLIGFVPDALPRLGCPQPHVVRILLAQRASHDAARLCSGAHRICAPGVPAVIRHLIITGIPRGLHELKGTVLQHLRVQPAVRGVIDVLEEQPYHALLYPCLFL